MSTTEKTINSYNKFAKAYDFHITNDDNFWNKYVEAPAMKRILENIVKGKKVLDLGGGSGVSTIKIKDWGGEVTGLDISSGMIELARQNFPNIEFKVGDMENTGFDDNSFDVVSSSLAIHYVKDLSLVFSEVNRILKPQGTFVFSMHHPVADAKIKVTIDGKRKYLLGNYFNRDSYEMTWEIDEGVMKMDSYRHTFSDITNSLVDSGFCVKKVIETTPIKEGKKIDPIHYERAMMYPSFIVFKADKI